MTTNGTKLRHQSTLKEFHSLLIESNYDIDKTNKLIKGFTEGFSIGYCGPENRRDTAANLPLKDLGNSTDLWNKVMKEVKLGRYSGPYKEDELPFDKFIQSPIGLVPKAGNKIRLIFHLSYDFNNGNVSLNGCTPKEICSVKYKDLDHAIDICMKLLKKFGKNSILYYSKTDLESAFRLVSVLVIHRKWLLMRAEDPLTKEVFYFIEKCLPFGVSISCAVFQSFSDALAHITEYIINKNQFKILTNYLDDFLFISIDRDECGRMVQTFLVVCKRINCPISHEKTEWTSVVITFLGALLDGERHCLCIPEEKRVKALNQVRWIKNKKKATIKEIQCLTGILNFLNRAIVPGRVFTRRMYAKLRTTTKDGKSLKQYHHVNLCSEFKKDVGTWELFLENAGASALCRPFLDWDRFNTYQEIEFFTDASGKIGYGCFFRGKWVFGEWDRDFLSKAEPSIEFLELFALVVGLITWADELANSRIVIFCDNQAVVEMVNNTTSSCRNCMYLLRLMVLSGLRFNTRVAVKYIRSADNILADSLSRLRFDTFWHHAPEYTESKPYPVPEELWPIQRYWSWK